MNEARTRWSLVGLMVANLLPVVGILWWGWSAFEIVLAYVLETVVVGVFTLLRMVSARLDRSTAMLLGPFFVVHYGMFVAIQSVFLFMSAEDTSMDWERLDPLWMVVGFTLSHGQSFLLHYLWGGLYKVRAPKDEMVRPYVRVVIQQFAAIYGFSLLSDGAMGAALIIVILKTGIDALQHVLEHRREALELAGGDTQAVTSSAGLDAPSAIHEELGVEASALVEGEDEGCDPLSDDDLCASSDDD